MVYDSGHRTGSPTRASVDGDGGNGRVNALKSPNIAPCDRNSLPYIELSKTVNLARKKEYLCPCKDLSRTSRSRTRYLLLAERKNQIYIEAPYKAPPEKRSQLGSELIHNTLF
eukprot:CAMPEP_0113563166 /NCGR_PEP_ID=MMETSP0015_2-20120614/20918_1 /TAXON_ID=2838 /ORGANISM="Odontella" /LENGTH=112 /DNA_ID=CAMNT_0000465117 /DNA_START=35 /DNA_END=373 /DNA_ORIENTATION=- /assembly_acc=CAM_ASM_000160